jgi:hypothetical protein
MITVNLYTHEITVYKTLELQGHFTEQKPNTLILPFPRPMHDTSALTNDEATHQAAVPVERK